MTPSDALASRVGQSHTKEIRDGTAGLGDTSGVVTGSPKESVELRVRTAKRGEDWATIGSFQAQGEATRATGLLITDAALSPRRGRHERSSGRSKAPNEARRQALMGQFSG